MNRSTAEPDTGRPVTAPSPTTAYADPGFLRAVQSEWTKFHTQRGVRITLIALVVVTIGLAAVISLGVGRGYTRLTPAEQATFDPAMISLRSYFPAQWLFGVLGVLGISAEYASGSIRATLAAVPRRGRLLGAKAAVHGTAVLLLGQAMAFGSFTVGQPMLRAQHAPTATLGDTGVARAVFGAGLYLALIGLLGLALGFLVRATVGAFAVLVALPLIPTLLPMLPDAIGKGLTKVWPTVAGERVMFAVPTTDGVGPWVGIAILAGFVAAVWVAAVTVFRRRDA